MPQSDQIQEILCVGIRPNLTTRSDLMLASCDMLVRKKMYFGAILSIVVQHTVCICNES